MLLIGSVNNEFETKMTCQFDFGGAFVPTLCLYLKDFRKLTPI